MEITKIEPAFEDERGSIWDFLTDENIHHIGFLISKKDSVRGSHYHKEQKQYTLVTKGKIKVTVKDLQDNDSKIETKELSVMEMVFFPSYYYHSIEAIEDAECLVLQKVGKVMGMKMTHLELKILPHSN
jgi:dTDP-4-dehydrorhamnose 3,5-epimerase-like enzyme